MTNQYLIKKIQEITKQYETIHHDEKLYIRDLFDFLVIQNDIDKNSELWKK